MAIDSRNRHRSILLDQFYGILDPLLREIGKIWAKIDEKLVEITKIAL